MSGTASIGGIISGLNTEDILSKLEAVAKVPVLRLESQKARLSAKLSAWQEVNSRLLALKEKASPLSYHTAFLANSATSSDESIVTASATSSAVPGRYTFSVESVATAHKVASQGYAQQDALVGDGTVTITVGSNAPIEIQADGLTLAGLRDAINGANAGVNAYIVNEGSGDTPYRLLLTSNATGTAGQLDIDVSLTGGTTPTFSDLQTAADAVISLGGGITVTRSNNTITDLIPGATLNLHQADPGQDISITITNDNSAKKQAIGDFVEQYNALIDYFAEQWEYDTDTNTGGLLFGDYSLSQIHSNLVSRISNTIAGLPSSLSLLSQAGIRLGMDGKLTLDETVLDGVLTSNPDGVMKLFSRYGSPTSAEIKYVSGTSDTKASGEAGYAVQITQVATHSRLTTGVAQADPLAEDEIITINGKTIGLTAGMTQAQVISTINARTSETGVTASATDINGSGAGQYLTLTTAGYGSHAQVTALSNKSNGAPGSSGIGNVSVTESSAGGEAGTGTGAAGVDVAGTIDGAAAEGTGRLLKSTAGDAKGLSLLVQAAATGDYGTVVYTVGAAAMLNAELVFLTEDDNSTIKTSEDTLQKSIDDMTESIEHMNESVASEQERIKAQFNRMELALSQLQTQSNYLTSQLAQINNNWE